jgi:deoxycytidylate deaminase
MNHSLTAIIKDKRGNILAIGKNSYTKTHPYQAKCAKEVGLPEKIYLHAEIDAILRCSDLSKAHSIHIFRQGKSGKWLLAKPCPACQTAINRTPIKKVYHT